MRRIRTRAKHSTGTAHPNSDGRIRCRVLDRVVPQPQPIPRQHNVSRRLHS